MSENPEANKVNKVSKNNQENLTFIDNDPNPTIPSVEKSSIGRRNPLTPAEAQIWTDHLRGIRDGLIKDFATAKKCEVNIKSGYDEDNDIDIWAPKKFKYHSLTVGEKHELNDLNAEIANIERDVYKRLDIIQQALETIKDPGKLKDKIKAALREQERAEESSNPSYHDLVNKRVEYQEKAMWQYFRMPKELYLSSSISDVLLALQVAEFIETNTYPLDHGIA